MEQSNEKSASHEFSQSLAKKAKVTFLEEQHDDHNFKDSKPKKEKSGFEEREIFKDINDKLDVILTEEMDIPLQSKKDVSLLHSIVYVFFQFSVNIT